MRIVFVMIFFCTVSTLVGQTVLEWSDLSEGISWEFPSSFETVVPGFQRATFGPKMRALEGKEVIIIGYLLVLDGRQTIYLLSKNPMASCFFCGNGGPETIMDLQFSQKPAFEMDDLVSVQGTLRLNGSDANACYYRIENANALSFK